MNVQLEEVERYGRRGYRKYVRLRDQDEGDLFYNQHDEPREWTTSSGARRWMRSIAEKHRGMAFRVTNLKGKVSFIGITEEEIFAQEHPEQFGPHEWHKVNLFTISDRTGTYDRWACELCGESMKRFGLAGQPAPGMCMENRKGGEDD
jgi:hypothetical protein